MMVFIVQLALIFWLSDRRPATVRIPAPAPGLQFAGENCTELLALLDPTLFALPNPRSFSGEAWLQIPPDQDQFRPPDRAETAAWLPLQTHQLGAVFNRFIQTNRFGSPQLPEMPVPQSISPDVSVPPLGLEKSALQIVGGLAGRRLATPMALGPWPHTDLLTNTVVQLMVDALGVPRSVTLLASCGLKTADDAAVDLARDMRFEPLAGVAAAAAPHSPLQIQWGQVVFAWQTVTMPATNNPTSPP
jgi:hypothetical protein